jgi:signal transduction histidine kinase
MNLAEFAVSVLLGLTSLLGVKAIPSDSGIEQHWQVQETWHLRDGVYVLEASSTTLPHRCNSDASTFIEFPVVIHGAHEVFLDGKKIASFGDPTFQKVRSFYGTLVVPCQNLLQGERLTWRLYSYSRYFARIGFWPRLTHESPTINFYQETLNTVAAGGLITLAVISLFVFWGHVSHLLTLSLVGTGTFFAGYFIATSASYFNIGLSMLQLHKLADCSLWLGTLLLFNTFRVSGLFGSRVYLVYCITVGISVVIIAIGTTGDLVQFGTTLPFAMFYGAMAIGLVRLVQKVLKQGMNRTFFLQIFSLCSFIFMSFNDVLVVMGLVNGPVLLSVGVLGGVSFLALDVHQRIVETYRERDYLRHHLEDEVTKKTAELSAKTNDLELALNHLRTAQADLIQSSKMASLGMMAAGIAHEINNSLNYVNGAIAPLRRLITQSSNFERPEHALKLLSVMHEGLQLTFEIMNNLRTYTGLNHAIVKEHRVLDLVRSTLTILKNRVPPDVRIEVDVPSDLEVTANAAGINQVLMNLVVNALDAIGSSGLIKISASVHGDSIDLSVSDDGPGIPVEIQEKVFDPFFTTKDVGKGTGLGLHISRNEILKHGGSIGLSSSLGQGSNFTITLPMRPVEDMSPCNRS